MKQSIKKWMCCAFVLCATVCLVACDKKDDPAPKVTGKITYKLNTYDLKDLMDIKVTYTDAAGKDVTEVVTDTTWTKAIENVNIPFTASLKAVYKKKANISYTKDSYKVTLYDGGTISYELSNGVKKPMLDDKPHIFPKNEMDECLLWIEEIGFSNFKRIE